MLAQVWARSQMYGTIGSMIPHYYADIPGFFDYDQLYDDVVENAADNSHFVEVGALFGRSTCYLAERIQSCGKRIRLDVVDTWINLPPDSMFQMAVREAAGDPYKMFLLNMERFGVAHLVRPLKLESIEAAQMYRDSSLDFVFLDADHSFEAVCRDIEEWAPKVKTGGILAGHDYYMPEVQQAVQETLGEHSFYAPSCWMVRR